MEIALLGGMGRDHALADRLVEAGHRLHAIAPWANAGLVQNVEQSGGQFHQIKEITGVDETAEFVAAIRPNMFVTNSDDALAAGVVDAVRDTFRAEHGDRELLIPSPDRKAARIEWDKFYLRHIVDRFAPEFNPVNRMVEVAADVSGAIDFFEQRNIPVAIKPRNLTGGGGVKVMGKNLSTHAEAAGYARSVLASPNQTGVEIQEKVEGHEFTLQILTDGKTIIRPPTTYDYSYREDGDKGPQTGGMGSITMAAGEQLPFLTQADHEQGLAFGMNLLEELRAEGLDYKGILYVNFFKTPRGLKFVEANARGGDPELINIVDLSERNVDWGQVLALIARGDLASDSVAYRHLASTMLYLTPPDYKYRSGPSVDFRMDPATVMANDCLVRFAAAERVSGHSYRSVGSSRSVGFCALGDTPWAARAKIDHVIREALDHPLPFEYRNDIGDRAYIQALGHIAAN